MESLRKSPLVWSACQLRYRHKMYGTPETRPVGGGRGQDSSSAILYNTNLKRMLIILMKHPGKKAIQIVVWYFGENNYDNFIFVINIYETYKSIFFVGRLWKIRLRM